MNNLLLVGLILFSIYSYSQDSSAQKIGIQKNYDFDIETVEKQTNIFHQTFNNYSSNNVAKPVVESIKVKDKCWDTQSKTFKSQKPGTFKILVLPFNPEGTLEGCTTKIALSIEQGIKAIAKKERVNIYCARYNCNENPEEFNDEIIRQLKADGAIDLVVYGSYSYYCNSNDAGVCINWLGDSIRTQDWSNPAKSLLLGNLDRTSESVKIDVNNIISGQVKSSLDFIVFFAVAASTKNFYYYERALAKATNLNDSILCMKQLALFQNSCENDSVDVNNIDFVLRNEPPNQHSLIIKAITLSNHRLYKETNVILRSIKREGLDTSIISEENFNEWIAQNEFSLGNSSFMKKLLRNDARDIPLLKFMAMNSNTYDSALCYINQILTNTNQQFANSYNKGIDQPYFIIDSILTDTFKRTIVHPIWGVDSINVHVYSKPNLKFQFEYVFLRGSIKYAMHNYYDALADFTMLCNQSPELIDTINGSYGDAFILKSICELSLYFNDTLGVYRLQEALDDIDSSINLYKKVSSPDNDFDRWSLSSRYVKKAIILHELQNYTSSDYYWERALKLLPDTLNYYIRGKLCMGWQRHWNLYTVDMAKQDFETQLTLWQKLKETDPYRLSDIYFQLAYCHAKLYDKKQASKALKTAYNYLAKIPNQKCQNSIRDSFQLMITEIEDYVKYNKF